MKKIIIIVLSLFIFCSMFAQKKDTTAKKMTAQDSAAVFQAEQQKALDSIVSKTTIKQFVDFLQSNVTVKQYNESKWAEVYDFFLRAKLQEWMQQKAKPKK